MFACSKIYRWRERRVLALSLRDTITISKSQLTVKTSSHLTHTDELKTKVSSSIDPHFSAYGVRGRNRARCQLTRANIIM